jgi:hypothetical protein
VEKQAVAIRQSHALGISPSQLGSLLGSRGPLRSSHPFASIFPLVCGRCGQQSLQVIDLAPCR